MAVIVAKFLRVFVTNMMGPCIWDNAGHIIIEEDDAMQEQKMTRMHGQCVVIDVL